MEIQNSINKSDLSYFSTKIIINLAIIRDG